MQRGTWAQEEARRSTLIDQQLQKNTNLPWLTEEALNQLLTEGRMGEWEKDESPLRTLEQALTILCGQATSAIHFKTHKDTLILVNSLANTHEHPGGDFYPVPDWLLKLYHHAKQLVIVLPLHLEVGKERSIDGKTYIVESCHLVNERDGVADEEAFDVFETPGWYSHLRLKE